MKQVTYVTGNKYKFEVAEKILNTFDIKAIQKNIETPEIQSADVEEIAKYSAEYAARKLNKPVVVTDAGWYIKALNGFPGPFIKYINQWLTSEDILKLMEGKENRNIEVNMCLAYCKPNEKPTTFNCVTLGTLAQEAVESEKEDNTPINKLFIPKGYDTVSSEIPREEMVKFWSKTETMWYDLADYLKNN